MREVVVEVCRSLQLKICHPRLIQHPGHRDISAKGIVTVFSIFPGECIRIVLRVHATDVACQSCLEADNIGEGVAIVDSDTCAVV